MRKKQDNNLKLGKGAAFAKSRLARLPQEADTWEADFQTLPKPITQTKTHYRGIVVAKTRAMSRAGPASTISPLCSPMPCAGP